MANLSYGPGIFHMDQDWASGSNAAVILGKNGQVVATQHVILARNGQVVTTQLSYGPGMGKW